MTIRFDDQVAIVTGAGNGLGRAHALGLAKLGAKVVINDLGTARDGSGCSSQQADAVVDDIRAAGGQAISNAADVTDAHDVEQMIEAAVQMWGRIDILVNNAGYLCDRSFAKMSVDEFDQVINVHLKGGYNCAKAVWEYMREQQYGRIVFTTSGSGLYGNFGQANYAAGKMGVIGLMNVLHIEGVKHDIRVNALAPIAATRMTEGLMSKEDFDRLSPDKITPGVLYLVSRDAPSRFILSAGAGGFARIIIRETEGFCLEADRLSPDTIAERFARTDDAESLFDIDQAFGQSRRLLDLVASASFKA